MNETGKVTWFDSERRCGVLTGVGGTALEFTAHADSPDLHAGEIVIYELEDTGAVVLRPARRRAAERGPDGPAGVRPVPADSPAATQLPPIVTT